MLLFLESIVVIGFFVPGISTLIAASFLAGVGQLDPLAVFLTAWAGIVLGDTGGYLVGRYANHLKPVTKLLKRLGKKVDIKAVQRSPALVFFQFIMITRTTLPPLLGATGFRWHSWLALECFASTLFIGTIVAAGYICGRITGSFTAVEKTILYMQIIFLIILLGGVVVALVKRRARKAAALAEVAETP